MTGRRTALLIANQEFGPESGLTPLRGPLNDITSMAEVLGDPDRGGFRVITFVNSNSFDIKAAIDEELGDSGRDDLVLIYYAGHGRVDAFGDVCLATRDTRSKALRSTSIPSGDLKSYVSASHCGSVVLILDCCFSGAAANATRGDIDSRLTSLRAESGFFILTASSETQSASEEAVAGRMLGKFTSVVLEGLRSGDADVDKDGVITLHDVFNYARTTLKNQSPKLYAERAGGDPIIARAPLRQAVSPGPLATAQMPEIDTHRDIRLALVDTLSHPARVVDVAFSRDDARMATVCDDGLVRIFDTKTFREVDRLQFRPNSLRSASWSKGGSEIATTDSRGAVRLWRNGGQIAELVSGSRALTCGQYSPNGLAFASGAEDGTVHLWHPQKRALAWKARVHRDIVNSVRFSADSRWLVTASADGQSAVMDVRTGDEISRFTRHTDSMTAAFFVSAEAGPPTSCVSTGLNGEIFIWQVHDSDSAFVATQHNFWVLALAYCDDAQLIVSGGYDAKIKIVDLKTRHVFAGAKVHQGPIVAVRTSHHEDRLVVTTHDGMVYMLDLSYDRTA